MFLTVKTEGSVSKASIEDRISALESTVAELLQAHRSAPRGWAGAFIGHQGSIGQSGPKPIPEAHRSVAGKSGELPNR